MKTETLKKLADELAKIADNLTGVHTVKTRLVWDLLNEKEAGESFKNQDVIDLAKLLFPGFDNTMPMTLLLAEEKLIKPALYSQHSQLLGIETIDEAIVKFGEYIQIHPMKKSNREEWQEWIEIIEPGFSYKEWRK